MVLTKIGSNAIYNTIRKFQKWLPINYAMNVARFILLGFYTFKGKKLQDGYINSPN
jgi:hypothetical protein